MVDWHHTQAGRHRARPWPTPLKTCRSGLMTSTSRPAAKRRVARSVWAPVLGGVATLALFLSGCGVNTGGGNTAQGTVAPTPTATVTCPSDSDKASWHLVNSS